jgi:hypothetical protein
MLMRVMRSGAPQHAAMKHVRLECERRRSSSRVVERPPRPPPSNRMVAERAAHPCASVRSITVQRLAQVFLYGVIANLCKMTYSMLAPNKRGLLAKITSANSDPERQSPSACLLPRAVSPPATVTRGRSENVHHSPNRHGITFKQKLVP